MRSPWLTPQPLSGGIGAAFGPIGAGNPAAVVAAPKIDRALRDLIRRMSKENPLCADGPCASPLHARSLRTSPENASNLRLVGGAGWIRTLGTARPYTGRIRPQFGALFGPNKSIRAGENLFAPEFGSVSALCGSLRRQTDGRNWVSSLATKNLQRMTEGDVLQFQDRPATESAAKNRDDGTHELKHAGDTTAAHPKALDFSERSEFLVATGNWLS
jgi:hypothetical protein